jgi:ABC-2 type transport system ATP-binding protein
MKEYLVRITNITKSYKKKRAVDNVTLDIEKGRIYGFIGQNGAGKTTLIKLLTGLSFADSGQIEMFGEISSKGLEKARKNIGYMVEHTGLYPNFTAHENIKLQCKYRGISDKNEIKRVLKIVGLEDTSNKKFKDFSLGMKQRLAIAVALIGDPKLLILDEPVNGLDPVGISEIRNMLLKLNAEKNITILISSHILSELHMLATDYIIIDDGKIVDNLTIEELDEKCKKYIIMDTDSIEKAKEVLHALGIQDKFIQTKDKKLVIPDANIDMKSLATAMYNKGIVLTELSHSGKSLENYFLESVGGKSIA